MKKTLVLIMAAIPFFTYAQEIKWERPSEDFSNGRLKVSPNHRFLEFENGSVFSAPAAPAGNCFNT